MDVHPRAGCKALPADLTDIPQLVSDYYTLNPRLNEAKGRVQFGTSGHRGCATEQTFNQHHILAITQAIADFRQESGLTGPLYLGYDTHALSYPAYITALQVLLANKVVVRVQKNGGFTPTPAISRAIIKHNQRQESISDGLIMTPSHNPPHHGGIKYNPSHGGPADKKITHILQNKANDYLERLAADANAIPCVAVGDFLKHHCLEVFDYIECYVSDLPQVIDMEAIQNAKLRVGIDPLGGSGLAYWQEIGQRYGLNFTFLNAEIDPTFRFVPLDHDGVIRMDCSSSWAMANLITKKSQFDLCMGNDADFDRFGLVSQQGLITPNHMLVMGAEHLIHTRAWGKTRGVGKTVVSSALLDRLGKYHGIPIETYPVGFKWFVEGLSSGQLGFAGEESAGANLVCLDGSVWSTDKDGIVIGLLALEIMAKNNSSLDVYYQQLMTRLGSPHYQRVDNVISARLKEAFQGLEPEHYTLHKLAGEQVLSVRTTAPANGTPFGGIKVETENAWFAIRPSGTEPIYKLYAESFISARHLQQVQAEAQDFVHKLKTM